LISTPEFPAKEVSRQSSYRLSVTKDKQGNSAAEQSDNRYAVTPWHPRRLPDTTYLSMLLGFTAQLFSPSLPTLALTCDDTKSPH
jgi:hypothetical protein